MSARAALTVDAPGRAEVVRELQERIRGMQRTRLDARTLPTHPALADLLPGGALAAGASYAVEGSTTLALGLLQGPSAAGSWAAVVGLPDLGVEAAAGLGIDLDRLALVPRPGQRWLPVVSALVDVVTVVLVAPPPGARVGEQAAARLAARLRQREAALVVLARPGEGRPGEGLHGESRLGEGNPGADRDRAAWPGAQARLRVTESSWTGIGAGFGHLTARRATIASEPRDGRPRARRLWLPGPDERIAALGPAEVAAAPTAAPAGRSA